MCLRVQKLPKGRKEKDHGKGPCRKSQSPSQSQSQREQPETHRDEWQMKALSSEGDRWRRAVTIAGFPMVCSLMACHHPAPMRCRLSLCRYGQ